MKIKFIFYLPIQAITYYVTKAGRPILFDFIINIKSESTTIECEPGSGNILFC